MGPAAPPPPPPLPAFLPAVPPPPPPDGLVFRFFSLKVGFLGHWRGPVGVVRSSARIGCPRVKRRLGGGNSFRRARSLTSFDVVAFQRLVERRKHLAPGVGDQHVVL